MYSEVEIGRKEEWGEHCSAQFGAYLLAGRLISH